MKGYNAVIGKIYRKRNLLFRFFDYKYTHLEVSMATRNYIAFDLGASNGRAIVGRFDGEKLTMDEIHRFANDYIDCNGIKYWDTLALFSHLKTGLSKYTIDHGKTLASMGIDTWGVDYGLLDRNDQLISNAISYRNSQDNTMKAAWEKIGRRELFDLTGIAHQNFNTVYQLYARKLRNDPGIENAKKMLFMPDLLGFFLTGEYASEYTITSTSMLYDPFERTWNWKIIDALGLPRQIFTQIQPSASKRGRLLKSIADELGSDRVDFIAVGEHDTASAVAAVPGQGEFAFLSSGTWSLFGTETNEPIISDEMYNAGYSNEGTVQGGFRPLRNIMGLWLIQQCKREWTKRGENISYDEIVQQARAAEPFRSIIDADYSEFFSTEHMEDAIARYCIKTSQPVPETKGQFARCIYESLALKYRWGMDRLEEIRSSRLEALHIVGGGIQNKLLNQFAANAIGRPVITGPIEGACIGNLLSQAIALGDISGIDQLREVVRASFDVERYEPQDSDSWEEAYSRFLGLLERQA